VYAWLSVFSIVGTVYGVYALRSLGRPGLRAWLESQAGGTNAENARDARA
jgi:hypothetical protein